MSPWKERAMRHDAKPDTTFQLRARIFLYLCGGLMAFFAIIFMYTAYIHFGHSRSDHGFTLRILIMEMLSALAFFTTAAYYVFIINRHALSQAERDCANLREAQQTIQIQKRALENSNHELTFSLTRMEETTREYEEANAKLMEIQQDLITSNNRLRESEERLSKAFDFSPLVISLATFSDDRYVDVSAYLTKIAGYSREEMIGQSAYELGLWADPDDYPRVRHLLETQGYVRNQEIRLRSRSGAISTLLLLAEVIQIGDIAHIASLAIDVTEGKRAEEEKLRLAEQLRQVQKMESVGRLAGGVAHDFNNLLSIILGYSEILLADACAHDARVCNALNQIYRAGERAQNLTRQLLAFGRKQVLSQEAVTLNQIILDFKPMLNRLIGEDIKIVTHLENNPWLVLVDVAQMEQILLNLAVNARDAMPQGGGMTIETANISWDTKPQGNLNSGEYVLLKVSDTGCGMDPAATAHIFEPFFTTKGKDKGTGLGLATVYGIVKQHHGEIGIQSNPEKGTVFSIYLPRLRSESLSVPPENRNGGQNQIDHARGTILVVEDEPQVRKLTCMTLSRHGYHVLEALDSREAIYLGLNHPTRIDLLLTDVVMPEMNGPQLANAILAMRPEMSVIFLSGFTEDELMPYGVVGEGMHFLQKPVPSSLLLQKVRALIGIKPTTTTPCP